MGGSIQNLTDLWLYRTIPRLDMIKEINRQLEKGETLELMARVKSVNQLLEQLEVATGSLSEWHEQANIEGGLRGQQAFAHRLNQLLRSHKPNFETLAQALHHELDQGLLEKARKAGQTKLVD